jgi:energy-coupling factor transport system permease protein
MDRAFGLYIAADSSLHRLHPLTKLALAGLLLAAGLLLPGPWLTYAAFGLVLVPLAALGRVAGRLLRAVVPVVLPFAVSVFLIQGFLWPGGTPVAIVGPLALKCEGLAFATAAVGRLLMVVGAFVLFALTTRPDQLMLGLTQRGLPPQLAYLVLATLQIVPRLQARAAAILDAQRARGLETSGSLARRARALPALVVPLILSSLVDVEERALALEARAFSRAGPKTSLVVIGEAAWEPGLRWTLAAGGAALALGRLALRWLD